MTNLNLLQASIGILLFHVNAAKILKKKREGIDRYEFFKPLTKYHKKYILAYSLSNFF
jgi:hypothetical protein